MEDKKVWEEFIIQDFEDNRNEAFAAQMKAYMKDRAPFYGIKAPLRKELTKEVVSVLNKSDYQTVRNFCIWAWKEEEREPQHVAIDLLKKYHKKMPEEGFQLIKELIITKSWWDTVDMLATTPLATLCKKYDTVRVEMDHWILHDNMWLRRSALLYQLKYKEEVDEDRLFRYIKQCMHEEEFFIRKAIGWVLREYGKWNKEAVLQFVSENERQLSGLSKREALRIILKNDKNGVE